MPRTLLVLFLTLTLCLTARAHDTQLSGLRFIVGSGSTMVSVMTHRTQLAGAQAGVPGVTHSVTHDTKALDLAIRQRLKVRLDGVLFTPQKVSVIIDAQNNLVMWQSRYPSEAASLEVLARLYPEDQTSKLVVSVVREGVTVQETLLDAAHPALLADSNASSPISVALRYVREGLLHIFGGPDHIAFVLGLLLFGGTLRQLLKTITAFTLAHSITLGIAATGIWNPSPRIVETLIALSITCIALENLRPHRTEQDLRAFLAFGFGLIHGFGFAGALSEVGLPQDTFWAALASFNIGVEMGQAAIVLAVAPLIARLTYLRPKSHRWIVILGSLAVGLAGLYWLLTRLLMPS